MKKKGYKKSYFGGKKQVTIDTKKHKWKTIL